MPPGIGCGTHDHFLERVRILYKDRFPITRGGLTISITRDDALQDVLERAVDMTLRTYVARHPTDADNAQLRAGAFAVDFTGDVLAEVGNVNFSQLKYDVMATGWRQPGSTFKIFTYGGLVEQLTNEVLKSDSAPQTVESIADRSAGTLHGAGRARAGAARPRTRRQEDRKLPLALGARVPRRNELQDRARRITQHGGDARRFTRWNQARDRARVSARHAPRRQACAAALPDDRDRRVGSQPAGDGVDGGVRQRRLSRDAAVRERCLPRRHVAVAPG